MLKSSTNVEHTIFQNTVHDMVGVKLPAEKQFVLSHVRLKNPLLNMANYLQTTVFCFSTCSFANSSKYSFFQILLVATWGWVSDFTFFWDNKTHQTDQRWSLCSVSCDWWLVTKQLSIVLPGCVFNFRINQAKGELHLTYVSSLLFFSIFRDGNADVSYLIVCQRFC